VIRRLLGLLLLSGTLSAQELLWSVWPRTDAYSQVATFGDFDHDGYDDLLAICWINNSYPTIRVLSGRDGSVLDQHLPNGWVLHNLVGVGDFDGDGYPDYAVAWDDQLATDFVEVWSPHLHQQLLYLTHPAGGSYGAIIVGNVDLNNDGQPDLLVGTTYPGHSDIYAYDHYGTLLYQVPAWNLGMLALAAVGVGDITGDQCDDFVVGGIERNGESRGVVALISGRTGNIVRVNVGELPYDHIGYRLCVAGDVDRDGKLDYATSNYWGNNGRSVLTIYSGATGVILQQWTSTTVELGERLIGGLDADLDGIPDLIGASPGFQNSRLGYWGRTHVYSTRDRQVLMHTEPDTTSITPYYAFSMASLGVQPGSPYPVFAFTWLPSPSLYYHRIEVWRCSPPATQVAGTGCSSTASVPSIGIRRVELVNGESSRLVLGSAPPGALAWCALAPASANTFGGYSLPLALDPFGFAGCTLYVPPTWVASRLVGAAGFDRGYAEVELGRPLAPSNLGNAFAAQWLVLDPVTLDHATTWRQQFRLQ